jgi:threonine dehydratase
MRDLFPPTPLQKKCHLSERFGAEIWLKREDLTPVGPTRSAAPSTRCASSARPIPQATRFVCASAGNHAQGVAFVCAHFGVTGRIYMPVTTPEQKILKTKTFRRRCGRDRADWRFLRRDPGGGQGRMRRRPARISCRPSTTRT